MKSTQKAQHVISSSNSSVPVYTKKNWFLIVEFKIFKKYNKNKIRSIKMKMDFTVYLNRGLIMPNSLKPL